MRKVHEMRTRKNVDLSNIEAVLNPLFVARRLNETSIITPAVILIHNGKHSTPALFAQDVMTKRGSQIHNADAAFSTGNRNNGKHPPSAKKNTVDARLHGKSRNSIMQHNITSENHLRYLNIKDNTGDISTAIIRFLINHSGMS